jgi:hypothetical protein
MFVSKGKGEHTNGDPEQAYRSKGPVLAPAIVSVIRIV